MKTEIELKLDYIYTPMVFHCPTSIKTPYTKQKGFGAPTPRVNVSLHQCQCAPYGIVGASLQLVEELKERGILFLLMPRRADMHMLYINGGLEF